jgi:hypothetical protein
LKDRFRHLKPLHGVIAVVTVMVLVLGTASFAFAFDSGGTPAATGPDIVTWTGHGATNGQLNTTLCDAGNPTPNDPANTPYLLWVLTTDGGSASGATLHLTGSTVGDYPASKYAGNQIQFTTPYVTPDSSLKATADFTVDSPGNGSWTLEISHGCSGAKPLTATKTANTSYTRDYGWDIKKSADPTEQNGTAGGPGFQSNYNVTVDQTITDSAITVSGEITVTNPAGNPDASFSVSDSVGGSGASVNCPTNTLAGGASTTCTYSLGLGSKADGTNTAMITSNTPGIDGTTAKADYAFGVPATTTGSQTVNVTDTNGGLGPASGDYTWQYLKDFACPTDASKYANGKYTQEFPNTATIDETGQSADANVTVNCTLPALQVAKTAAGTFNRDISWQLTKSANPTSFNGIAGQTFNPTDLWDVNATKAVNDSGYKVAGDITITNPAAIDQSFNVADVLNTNNTAGNVDCDPNAAGNQASGTIAANGSVTCSYTASPSDASATLNTATVSAQGNADQTGKADVSFTPKVTGDEATTLGDARFNFSQGISSDKDQTFSDSFACDANNSSKYVNDKYSFDVTNTATLKGANTDLSRNAKVTVNCTRTRVQGGLTMGFWQNTNGQALIKNGPTTGTVCNSRTYLRTFAPFQDLSPTAKCSDVATYVTNVIKAANASGASMNAMLKAQMLATALDVNFGKVNGTGNVDLTAIPKPVTSSTYENTSTAFGGGSTCQSVNALLSYASNQSNSGGSIWYAQVKATQEKAKDTFDAINNQAAFTC